MNEKSKSTLVAARELIAAGWVQGAPVKATQFGLCYCALGAVSVCAGGVGEVLEECVLALRRATGELGEAANVVAFNDRPGRTQAEVVALFDRALGAS